MTGQMGEGRINARRQEKWAERILIGSRNYRVKVKDVGGPQYELLSFVLTALSSSGANISDSRYVRPQTIRDLAPQWIVSVNAFITTATFLRQSVSAF